MNDKSMIEVAKEIMESSNEPVAIDELIDKVFEILNLGDDSAKKAQLYIDITTSAEFVYCGDPDLWDLKTRQSLDVWDRSFYEAEGAADDDDNGISLDDYNYVEDDSDEFDDDEEENSWNEEEEDEEDEVERYDVDAEADGDEDEDDEDSSWDDDDEEKYNDMMDDYEDLYDDK